MNEDCDVIGTGSATLLAAAGASAEVRGLRRDLRRLGSSFVDAVGAQLQLGRQLPVTRQIVPRCRRGRQVKAEIT